MLEVRVAENEADRGAAFAVRREVFVEEQGVDEALEYDDHDSEATHLVAVDGDEAIGAARLRRLTDVADLEEPEAIDTDGAGDVGKVERVAVRRSRRGEGVGQALMDAAETCAESRGLGLLVLHAQTRVVGFYREHGYEQVGDEFEEAGIPHVEMRKRLQ
ncbi:GNAT family N-acetyltransferase [Natrinema longum]|uniref:GNAT family N-acetyltransferase n=1 Tax=Natrinema longum TaxID=370324 RepID=A0A8A2U7Q0_9EURY|nr:GNAT family N-acetyltransferase [Natrinema longum]MBZ6493824.1 GNAT family N-acetyltransferase [Natrinema longum]QSW84839.1 GNAT family N-acetyltransferase [Natrinema longum]